jgi:hydroxymethylpyrimidine/phosphomethylpyrimidine kinase
MVSVDLPIALTIAGSDSGGGAGIQADLKAFSAFGVFGTSAVTAVTAQNTMGVTAVHPIPTDVVAAQLEALAADLPPKGIKSGMLATSDLVRTVARGLDRFGGVPYVLDPVMVATSGDRLLEEDAVDAVRTHLLPRATIVTPNLPEAAILTGAAVEVEADMEDAARDILAMGPRAVLLKGGHLDRGHAEEPGRLVDLLVTDEAVQRWERERIETRHTHGTGCTLSAALAAGLARGLPLRSATERALDYVARAIAAAPGLGGGHGPVNHFVDPGLD